MDALLHATLATAILGLLALTYASETLHPPLTPLNYLTTDDIQSSIRVHATVAESHTFEGGSILLSLSQNDTRLKAYLPYHTATHPTIHDKNMTGCQLELTGELTTYRGELELVIDDPDAITIKKCP